MTKRHYADLIEDMRLVKLKKVQRISRPGLYRVWVDEATNNVNVEVFDNA